MCCKPNFSQRYVALGKGFYQVILEERDSASNLITLSPCQVRNTWLFMRKWTHGFNPEKAQHEDSMKKVTMLFPRLSLELQHATSYHWKLLWYDAGRRTNASGQTKETPRPSLYPPIGA